MAERVSGKRALVVVPGPPALLRTRSSRLRDDPDACHAYALRCAAKNSLNWRLTAERSLYIHGATSLCFRTRQLNTDDSLDHDRPTDNI